jgi:hypothetical protein
MFSLEGKSAIITGAGSGIGRAIAETFARQGAHVVVVDLSVDQAQEVVRGIQTAGGSAEPEAEFDILKITQGKRINFHVDYAERSALTEAEQIIETYDVATGPEWWEGINKVLPAEQLAKNMPKMLDLELERCPVRLKAVEPEFGRGLVASRGIRGGKSYVQHPRCILTAKAVWNNSWHSPAMRGLRTASGHHRLAS